MLFSWFKRPNKPKSKNLPMADVQRFRPRVEGLEDRRTPALLAPAGIQLTPTAPTRVQVDWTDTTGETGYRIVHWDGTESRVVGTVGANANSFVVTGLKPYTKQWLAVEAFNSSETAKTAWQSTTTPQEPITVPLGLTATAISTTRVRLNWIDAVGETNYNVYRWDGAKAVKLTTLGKNNTRFFVSGLQPAKTYFFYVEALNSSNSAVTDWVSVKTQAVAVTAPTTLTATALSATQVRLSWSDSNNETGYRIFQWNGSKAVQIGAVSSVVHTFNVRNLTGGKLYYFYVEAYNGSVAVVTDWRSVITPFSTALTAPANLTATPASQSSVTLRWSASTGAEGYRVYAWNGASWLLRGTITTLRSTYATTITGLTPGRTWWFLVQAYRPNNVETVNSATVPVAL